VRCLIYLQVNDQISSLGGDRASVILVLTDGQLSDLTRSQQQVSHWTAHMMCMHKYGSQGCIYSFTM